MVFKTIESDITKSGQSLSVFRKEFKNVYRDFMSAVSGIKENGITKDGLKQFSPFRILGKSLSKQDIQALKNYNEEIRKYNEMTDDAVSPQTAFYKCLGNSSAAAQKLARDANGAAVSEKVLESETIRLTLAQKASAIASKVMGTALKTALNIGLMLAINGIISKITEQVNKQEELIESAKQSAQETKEFIGSLDGLKDKYLEIVDSENSVSEKTQELNKFKQELVETYGFEKDIIDKLNLSREYGIAVLEEEIAKIKERNYNLWLGENRQTFEKAKHKIEKENIFAGARFDAPFGIGDINISKIDSEILKSFAKVERKTDQGKLFPYTIFEIEGNNLIEKYKTLEEIISKLGEKNELTYDEELLLDELNKNKKKIGEILGDYQEVYDLGYENEALKLYNSYVESVGDASKLSGKELENWKQGLLEQADGNTVLEESLESLIDKVYQFNDAETELSLSGTGIGENLSESLQTALAEYKDKISDFLSEKDKIDSALKEQEENGSISVSTAFELSQTGYQSALKYDSETKAYKLLRSEINKTAESRIAETKAKLESEKASAIQSIKDETENWRKNTGRTKDDIMYLDKLDKNRVAINEISDAYDLYIRMLEDSDDTTSDFSDTISKLNDKLEECKESVQSLSSIQSTVKSATKEQNTFGRLSADTINALHEAGLDGATAYNEMTGETYLLVDAIDELTRAKIDNQKADIKQGIIDTTNAITKSQEDLNNLGVIDSPDDAAKALELNRYIAELEKTRADLQFQKQITTSYKFSFETDSEDIEESAEEAAEETVEEYTNSIKEAFDKEKSDLDHLLNMDVISQEEYYNRLFDLNEKYFKGKTELLDEYRQYEEEVYKGLKQVQIDALQEQIDALKSVNEEKQEEIDLEKAKQALENAKRNKTVKVYDSERGWIRETDRNAIDSAQKEYDDLVLNEQVEVLENLIDAIENGTNTNHSLDESVNAFEQVNSLGQRVIPGNVDLTQLFSGAVANRMNEIQNSVNSNIPATLANQFNRSISSDSYTTNNNNTITLNGVTVMANNPEEFIAQMEDIANERFKENFPAAINQFGRDLKRYQMNHSF